MKYSQLKHINNDELEKEFVDTFNRLPFKIGDNVTGDRCLDILYKIGDNGYITDVLYSFTFGKAAYQVDNKGWVIGTEIRLIENKYIITLHHHDSRLIKGIYIKYICDNDFALTFNIKEATVFKNPERFHNALANCYLPRLVDSGYTWKMEEVK